MNSGGRLKDILLAAGSLAAVAGPLIALDMRTDSRISQAEQKMASDLGTQGTHLKEVMDKQEKATETQFKEVKGAIEKQGKELKEVIEKLVDKVEKLGDKNAEALVAIARVEVGQQVAAGGFLLLVIGGVLYATRNN